MVKQTELRNLRIRMRDVLLDASHVFPFFDGSLRVRVVLVIAGAGHVVFYEKPRWARRGLMLYQGYTSGRPIPLRDARPHIFHRLLHFDPWWTMRDAQGFPATVRDAAIATNLAARRQGHLVVRDVAFDDMLEQVRDIRIGDGVFRPVVYTRTRPMPLAVRQAFLSAP